MAGSTLLPCARSGTLIKEAVALLNEIDLSKHIDLSYKHSVLVFVDLAATLISLSIMALSKETFGSLKPENTVNTRRQLLMNLRQARSWPREFELTNEEVKHHSV